LVVPLGAACATGPAPLAITGFLAVLPDGAVSLALPKTEMGQGILTAITMLVAEELGVAPTAVTLRFPRPTRPVCAHRHRHGRLDLDPRAVEALRQAGCQCAHGADRGGGPRMEGRARRARAG
jgi:hypothetical protein